MDGRTKARRIASKIIEILKSKSEKQVSKTYHYSLTRLVREAGLNHFQVAALMHVIEKELEDEGYEFVRKRRRTYVKVVKR